jgi:hypothetical protein
MNGNLERMAGRANNSDAWDAIVGETVEAAFEDTEHCIVVVMRSGTALVLTSLGGQSVPAYWVERRDDWEPRLNRVRTELLRVQGGLRRLLFAGLDEQ